MKSKNIPNGDILSLEGATLAQIAQVEPQILPTSANKPEDSNSDMDAREEDGEETDEEIDEEIEEEIEEIEEEAVPPQADSQNEPNDAIVAAEIEKITKEKPTNEQDAKEQGFEQPFYVTYENVIGETSVPRNLFIFHLADIVIKVYLPPIQQRIISPEEICCVQDAPIRLTYNGILIYTGEDKRDVRESFYQYNGDNGSCHDCCCEVPPPPEPNYWFTYTNCDGEAYIDLYIEKKCCYPQEQFEQAYYGEGGYSYSGEYENGNSEGCVEHYRIEFFPGFEPECGCDIVSVLSNVLKAESIEDFVDPYITLSNVLGGEGNNDFSVFEYDRFNYSTHFEDACGVCWSIVSFCPYGEAPALNGDNGNGYYNSYYLIPVCASPVEFDTICNYSVYESNEYDGGYSELYLYANDGYYSYESNIYSGGDTFDSYRITVDVNLGFIELVGNSLLALNFDLSVYSSYSGDSGYGSNNVTLLVDVPDTMGYDANYINNFILCNEQYFDDFFTYVVKNAGGILDNVRDQNQLTDADALALATYVIRTYSIDADCPSYFPKVAGVLEDNSNNVYGLSFTGGSITTSAFNQSPFSFEDVYLTNLQLTNPDDANIVKTDLEICYCGDSIIQRFEEFQAANGCDSTYGDPRAYIEQYVDAHFVEQGCNRYLEINYAVPVYDACNGWSEGTIETFRVCVDDNICLDQLCINAQSLFQNYYNYGYVNFGSLLNTYEEPAVFFKNEKGDCYTIESTYYGDSEGEGEEEESNMECDYELVPCECKVEIEARSINNNENVSVYSNTIDISNYYNFTSHYYYLNFSFVHDEYGSSVKIDYTYYGGESEIQECVQIEVQNANLDCCCAIEELIVDANDLNAFVTSYLSEYDGQYVTLDQFLYYFSEEGNLNFYDCDKNCYNFAITYEGESQPTTYAVVPCDEESCCKSEISVEYFSPEPTFAPTISVAGVEETCFDQFFDFQYINCNGLSYIDFTWYYNNYPASDCFTFPIESEHLLISVPDDICISCECPLTLTIPPSTENDYSQYFQDCCTLSDYNYSETGYGLLHNLACDLAVLSSNCDGDIRNYVLLRDYNGNYKIAEIGENYIRTTTLTDENDFSSSYIPVSFADDLDYATNNGDGLSLRECIILNNLYDEDVDSILLKPGTYYIEIPGSNEQEGYTGDFDVFKDVMIVGGCETVIDANYYDRAFDVVNANLTLVNLAVQNGELGYDEGSLGGGVKVALFDDGTSASLTLNDAIIRSNTAYVGGGVDIRSFSESSSATLTLLNNSQMYNNNTLDEESSGSDGGGVYASNANIFLNDSSIISYNSAVNGGGIQAYNSSIYLNDSSKIYNNYAYSSGGGINVDTGSVTLYDNSQININHAESYGGGIFAYNASVILYDNTGIDGNSAANGGGLSIQGAPLDLYNASSISNNSASNDGGGVYAYQIAINLNDSSEISNNTAQHEGGGILSYNSPLITLNDYSEVNDNYADNGGGIYDEGSSFINVGSGEFSTITGNVATTNGGGVFTNAGTFVIDPDGRITGNTPDNIFPPLVLDLNHDGKVSLVSANDSKVSWDVYGDGVQHKTGWVGPQDGILVYDIDGDKAVTDISEFMLSSYHPDAKTDLEGLKLAFDSNHDGAFDSNDDHFKEFGVWQDKNGDGKTDQGEFFTLDDLDIQSISLLSDNNSSLQDGNTIFGFSTYKTSEGEHRIADVGLAVGKPILDINDVIKPQDSITNVSSAASQLPVQNNCSTCETAVVEQICPPPLPVQALEEQPLVIAA